MIELYCLDDFKIQFEKLISKKAYSTLEADIIKHFCGKELNEVRNGVLLNASDIVPYIKKRIKGSGGYRVYFLVVIKNNRLYLMFLHPKTGPDGSENITEEAKKSLYDKVKTSISTNQNLYSVDHDVANNKLVFVQV